MTKEDTVEKVVLIKKSIPTAHDIEVAMSIMAVNPMTNFGLAFTCSKTKANKSITKSAYNGSMLFPRRVRGISIDTMVKNCQDLYGFDNVMVLDDFLLDVGLEQEPDFTPAMVEDKINELLKSATRKTCDRGISAPFINAVYEPGVILAVLHEDRDQKYDWLRATWDMKNEPSTNVWTFGINEENPRMTIKDFANFYCSIAEEPNLAERYRKYMALDLVTRRAIISFDIILGKCSD